MQKSPFQDLANAIVKRLNKQYNHQFLRHQIDLDRLTLCFWQEMVEVDINWDCWNIWIVVYGQLIAEKLLSHEDAFPNLSLYDLREIQGRIGMKIKYSEMTVEQQEHQKKYLTKIDFTPELQDKNFYVDIANLTDTQRLTAVRAGIARIQGSELYKMDNPFYFALEDADQNKVTISLEALAVHISKKQIEKLPLTVDPQWSVRRDNNNPQIVSNAKLSKESADKLNLEIEENLNKLFGAPKLNMEGVVWSQESRSEPGLYRVIVGLKALSLSYPPVIPDEKLKEAHTEIPEDSDAVHLVLKLTK